jgi:hypothetical protein
VTPRAGQSLPVVYGAAATASQDETQPGAQPVPALGPTALDMIHGLPEATRLSVDYRGSPKVRATAAAARRDGTSSFSSTAAT